MVKEILKRSTPYSLFTPDFIRWSEAARVGDPLAKRWSLERLSPTELATLRIRVDSSVELSETIDGTLAGWIAVRLRAHSERGKLLGRSARDIAAELWSLFPTHRNPKYPFRGIHLLGIADEIGDSSGVHMWIDGAPVPGSPMHYRRMRFKDRLTELEIR